MPIIKHLVKTQVGFYRSSELKLTVWIANGNTGKMPVLRYKSQRC